MEVEITGKKKEGQPMKSWEEHINKDLEWYDLRREDVYGWNKWWVWIKAKTTC